MPSHVPLADAVSMMLILLHPPSFLCEHSTFRDEEATRVFLFTHLEKHGSYTPTRELKADVIWALG